MCGPLPPPRAAAGAGAGAGECRRRREALQPTSEPVSSSAPAESPAFMKPPRFGEGGTFWLKSECMVWCSSIWSHFGSERCYVDRQSNGAGITARLSPSITVVKGPGRQRAGGAARTGCLRSGSDSTVTRPPMGLDDGLDEAQAEAEPARRSGSCRRGRGAPRCGAARRGDMPMPVSCTLTSASPFIALVAISTRPAGRRVFERVVEQVGDAPGASASRSTSTHESRSTRWSSSVTPRSSATSS